VKVTLITGHCWGEIITAYANRVKTDILCAITTDKGYTIGGDFMFIVISDSCVDCGARAVGLFTEKPGDIEINDMADSIGNMFCIRSEIYSVEVGEIKVRGDIP
jgi:hypothetical protein